MKCPDDTPQDIWETAVAVTAAQPTSFGWRQITETMARALVAERERGNSVCQHLLVEATVAERERCALIADAEATYDAACGDGTFSVAPIIAKKIRAGATK